MRVITQYEFGGPEVLTIEDAPTPVPIPTDVLVRVAAIGLNPLEARVRRGEMELLGPPPFVLGWDVAGTVEQTVSPRFAAGDEVLGMVFFPRPGNAYAEYVAAPALHFVRKPAALSWVEAAALPIVGLTAWQGLVDVAQVGAGDRVLILGGGGGVGHVAVQIARARGAHVIATAGADKVGFVEGLGAHEVVDRATVDIADAVGRVDVVLDTVGGDVVERSLAALRPGGWLVTAVAEDDERLIARAREAGVRLSGIAVDPDRVGLAALVDLVERGELRVHVQQTFPFDGVVDAHRMLDAGHLTGKLVLTL